MSNPIVNAATGVTKGIMWLLHVLTQTQSYAAQISKLSGPTLAALLAVFYDVMKLLLAAQSAAGAAEGGDIPAAFSFSETTLGLLKGVAADAKNVGSTVETDLKTLGIVK